MPPPLNRFDRVCKILDDHDRNPARLIPILQAVQDEYRYLPEEIMVYVATSLGLPPARVYGVATFYSHFALEPRGKYIIRLCDGTACHVKGSLPIIEALQRRLDLTPQRKTTPDLRFTLETVSCLGACGLAPVLVINDEIYGQMTAARAVELIEELIAKETQHVNPNT